MKNEQILKQVIEKAVGNGYKPKGILGGVLRGEIRTVIGLPKA